MGKTIKNIITGKEITKPDPVDVEVPFDGGVMITETDTAGIITYANRKFRNLQAILKKNSSVHHTVLTDILICQKQLLKVCGKP